MWKSPEGRPDANGSLQPLGRWTEQRKFLMLQRPLEGDVPKSLLDLCFIPIYYNPYQAAFFLQLPPSFLHYHYYNLVVVIYVSHSASTTLPRTVEKRLGTQQTAWPRLRIRYFVADIDTSGRPSAVARHTTSSRAADRPQYWHCADCFRNTSRAVRYTLEPLAAFCAA